MQMKKNYLLSIHDMFLKDQSDRDGVCHHNQIQQLEQTSQMDDGHYSGYISGNMRQKEIRKL